MNLHQTGPNANATIKFDVLITSYQYAIREKGLLSKFKWRAVVIDEAHRLKSGNDMLTAAIFRLRKNKKILILLNFF